MSKGSQDVKQDERATPDAGSGTFDRSFKYAIIIYVLVEAVAIALLLYYKFAR